MIIGAARIIFEHLLVAAFDQGPRPDRRPRCAAGAPLSPVEHRIGAARALSAMAPIPRRTNAGKGA
jgi:hypothetical protein